MDLLEQNFDIEQLKDNEDNNNSYNINKSDINENIVKNS